LRDTFDGSTVRIDDNEYEIGVTSTLTIKPKQIFSTADCSPITVLQFQNPWGDWKEIRNGHMNLVVETALADKKIDFDITQKDFLEYAMDYAMYLMIPVEELNEITINCQFVHTATNGKILRDPFTIKVKSSG
jgi:hypothetical protein